MAKQDEIDRVRLELELEELRGKLAAAKRATRKAQDGDEDAAIAADLDACKKAAKELRADGARVVRINNFVVEYEAAPSALPVGLASGEAIRAAVAAAQTPEPEGDEAYIPGA